MLAKRWSRANSGFRFRGCLGVRAERKKENIYIIISPYLPYPVSSFSIPAPPLGSDGNGTRKNQLHWDKGGSHNGEISSWPLKKSN